MKRITAMLLCVLLIVGLLSGCGATGLKIDGKNVDLAYYGFYFGACYATNGMQGEEYVSELAMENLKQYYAVKKLAKEYGVELEPLERKDVIDSVTAQKVSVGGSATWKTVLDLLDLSEGEYTDIQLNYALSQKLMNHLFAQDTGIMALSDEEVAAAYSGEFVHCRHILISTQTATEQSQFDAAKKKAEEALARARSGEDFVALMHEYDEDPGQTDDGYYFTEGQMVDAFETASYALAEGEISDLVQTSYGFHIIQRLPVDPAYALSMVDTYYPYYSAKAYSEFLATHTDAMVVETTDEFFSYDLNDAVSVFYG